MSRELTRRGFLSLVTTQFLGAANDNLLKGTLLFAVALGGVWSGQLGAGGQAYVSLCLTVPFILVSGIAGQVCDRYSKQRVTVMAKVAEIGIAALVFAAFYVGSLWMAMSAMLLMGTQSAFFGPAKFGAIPELVDTEALSPANGVMNLVTNIAVIGGTVAAGPIYASYDPATNRGAGEPLLWVPGVIIGAVAVVGLLASFAMPRLEAKAPGLPLRRNPFGIYADAAREMRSAGLLRVALAWSLFYLVAMMSLLILADYRELLGVSTQRAAGLLGVLGISIGIGSAIAGAISGRGIRLGLVPVGAAGVAGTFAVLGLAPLRYPVVACSLFALGLFAGFYIVPLQALLQKLAPEAGRGRILATVNALGFLMGTAGSAIFLGARNLISSNHVFLVCAALWIGGAIALVPRLALSTPLAARAGPVGHSAPHARPR